MTGGRKTSHHKRSRAQMIPTTIFSRRGNPWYRRRWLDFRNGHSIYLVFIMTFANFIAIQYNLIIEKLPIFASMFDNLWIFAILFLLAYIPLAIMIGYWHRKSQWKVETEAMFRENEIGASLWLFMINLLDGKVSEEQKSQMIEMLSKIANRSNNIEKAITSKSPDNRDAVRS
jgi:hypothetical protein